MKKNLYIVILTIFTAVRITSQVGINTGNIAEGVMLQIESSNKGVLFPRVALTSRTSTSPLASTIPTGTMVFNTATVGNFPDIITQGLHWWSAEEQQWTSLNVNLKHTLMKYINTETSTNYNINSWQNVKLFGNKIINESAAVYDVSTAGQSVTIHDPGLYSISALLSFNRDDGDDEGRVSLSARIYVNGNPAGTEQVFSPGFTASVNDNRGLFSHSFTEYLELADGDVVTIKIRKTPGTYCSDCATAQVRFYQGGDSSIAILRIR
ncbi:hypothetical protein ACQWU4_13935 [Chryseobacterium sp. MIQD13]|uniref:hypothetical protein n=1 Tax=Chryseobacterium sp. MIQD13 TaxID=3422310 RepID=UPI003D27ED16